MNAARLYRPSTAEDMALYTKHDFVPRDRVIFYDDFTSEELGEFPSRWRLDRGVFAIAKQGGKSYVMCADKGGIRPKIAVGPLPLQYTFEMEFYATGPDAQGRWFSIHWLDAEGDDIGQFIVKDNSQTHLNIAGKDLAAKSLVAAGVHTMRIMATKTTLSPLAAPSEGLGARPKRGGNAAPAERAPGGGATGRSIASSGASYLSISRLDRARLEPDAPTPRKPGRTVKSLYDTR